MKTFVKKLAVVISLVLTLTVGLGMFGCGGPRGGGEQVDTSRTQLYIGSYGGGYGVKWVEDLKTRFEAAYANQSFEEGRMGVQVLHEESKSIYGGSYIDQASYDKNEVVFFNDTAIDEYVEKGVLVDITDVVTSQLTEFGEEKSIADKMHDSDLALHKINDKFYSLPDNYASLGVSYDIGLWEEKGFYFAKGGCPSEYSEFTQTNNTDKATGSFEGYQYTKTGAKSAGPDGKYGTYDDGLPALIEEFKELLKKMKTSEVDAMIWTGQVADTYTSFFTNAVYHTNQGVQEASLMFTGANGTTEIISGFDAQGNPIIEKNHAITADNYKDLAKQSGRYYALDLISTIISGGHASSYCWQDLSHTRTQEKFLHSNYQLGERPIAMMIEGAWWENEATEAGLFVDCEESYGEEASKMNRKFGFLPMPHATMDRIGNKQVLTGSGASMAINKNISSNKLELAKLFVRFAHTDASLRAFNVTTGLPKAFKYDLTDSDYDNMSYFAKEFQIALQSADILNENMSSAVKYDSAKKAMQSDLYYSNSVQTNGVDYSLFVKAMYYDKITAREFFEGIYRNVNA